MACAAALKSCCDTISRRQYLGIVCVSVLCNKSSTGPFGSFCGSDFKLFFCASAAMPRLCLGPADGGDCIFSTTKPGRKAQVSGQYVRCKLCDADRLQTAMLNKMERGILVAAMQKFNEETFEAAMTRIPEEYHAYFENYQPKVCQGRDEEPCVFALASGGGPAQTHKQKRQCCFCEDGALERLCATARGRSQIVQKLKKLGEEARAKALNERVPAEHKAILEEALAGPARQAPAARRKPAADVPLGEVRRRWAEALQVRVANVSSADSETLKKYRQKVLGDQARARRQLVTTGASDGADAGAGPARGRKRRAAEEEIENDSGLPPAKMSRLSQNFEQWCRFHSWSMRSSCHCLTTRDLTEGTLHKDQTVHITEKACPQCRGSAAGAAPQWDDVPPALQALPSSVREALVPLEIDVGPFVRAQNQGGYPTGYRQHSTMMRFRWKPAKVKQTIQGLPRAERRQARAAYDYLMAHQDVCTYEEFITEHGKYLAAHEAGSISIYGAFLHGKRFRIPLLVFLRVRLCQEPDERQRRRRLQFIERVGLECALWPWLFWRTDLCFSHVRANDPRRLARQSKETLEHVLQGRMPEPKRRHRRKSAADAGAEEPAEEEPSDAEQEPEEEEDDGLVRHSVKRHFQKLALGPLMDYSSNFHILQYVFDLHLWSDLGSKKNLGSGVSMRVIMKGNSFSPLYWKEVHFTLLDAVRQLGYPKLFFTIAPYEWSFPYHAALQDAMKKQVRARLELPFHETLHITHVLMQTIRGLLVGSTGNASKGPWRSQMFQVVDEQGKQKKLHAFTRLEFQDGHRKEPTQAYHGSGRVHVHALIFCDVEDLPQLELDKKLSATLPKDDPVLRGFVEGSQLDRKRKSGWPLHAEASTYDMESKKLLLHHTPEDKAAGLRAYVPDLMAVLQCHQDWQFADDDGMLRAYVTKYVSKFSDSASDEWLNDHADATSIASTVLMRYKPMEPEMVLQLCGQKFRQWHVTTMSRGRRYFQVPWPEKAAAKKPAEIEQYEAAAWARGKISLLDFLRKTTKDGEILAWLKKAWKQSGEQTSLETFAANYRMQGEKLVAADMVSRLNDHFYGQWLVLHVPFKRLETDLICDEIAQKVPAAHRNFAWALSCPHPVARAMWHDEAAMRAEMKLEAHTKQHIDTVVQMVHVNHRLVEDYMNGKFDAAAEAAARETAVKQHADRAAAAAPEAPRWNAQQRLFKEKVDALVDQALALDAAEDEDAADEILEDLHENSKICVCTGPPGSGKSTVAHACIERALELGGRVLFALPKAQLASRMRERYGDRIDIDTCHAAFAFNEEVNNLPTLAHYTLVVVDEISQLTDGQFERIVQLWNAADRSPVVVLLGDKWQMTGFGEKRPWHAAAWTLLTFRVQLHTPFRCKDPDFWKVLAALRTSRPDKKLLKVLGSKKPWPGNRPPTAEEVRKLLKSRPNTTILTVSRVGTKMINDAALEGLFPRFPPKAVLDADMESNPDNYVGTERKPVEELVPLKMPVYVGMQVYLTRNVRKAVDFVNGMKCEARACGFVIKLHIKSVSNSFCRIPCSRSPVGTPRTRACM